MPVGIVQELDGPSRVKAALGVVKDVELESPSAIVQLFGQWWMQIVEALGSFSTSHSYESDDLFGDCFFVAVLRANGDNVIRVKIFVDPGASAACAGLSSMGGRQIALGG